MWTLKIAILAVGVTVTAFAADSASYNARCIAAGEMTAGKLAELNIGAPKSMLPARDCPAS